MTMRTVLFCSAFFAAIILSAQAQPPTATQPQGAQQQHQSGHRGASQGQIQSQPNISGMARGLSDTSQQRGLPERGPAAPFGQGLRGAINPPQQRSAQQQHRFDWGSYTPGRRPPEWDRNRGFDRRFWERNARADRHYNWGRYVGPRGWSYQRWAFGMILPSLFWGRQYWINDYWDYGLADPPYGFVWVRYSTDALLVDVETGRILRVEYGLFY